MIPSRRRLPSPRRSRALVVGVALVLAVVASACNPGRPPAVTIDGTDVSAEHVDQLVRAAAQNSPEARKQSAGDGAGDTYQLRSAVDVLQVLIERVVVSNEARRRGIFPSPQDVDSARADLVEALALGGGEGAGEAVLQALSDETRTWLIDISADVVALRQVLVADPAVLRDFYDANPDRFLAHCYRVIQLAPGDVDTFGARYDGGEDFGALATDLSTDPQLADSAGEAGCGADLQVQQQLPADIWAGITEVIDGGLAGPFPAGTPEAPSDDVLFFEVSVPTVAPFEQVEEFLTTNIDLVGRDLSARLLTAELDDAKVHVDPRFGRWDAEARIVVAPRGPRG